MGIKCNKQSIFKNNISSLKETSRDKNDKSLSYMTESLLEVVNFDKVKSDYIRGMRLTDTPCSVDALYCADNGKIYLIEFKNGNMDTKTIFNVQEKIYTSLLLYTDIENKNISYCRQNMSFILVYNEMKNKDKVNAEKTKKQQDTSKRKIGKYFSEKGKGNFIAFGLEKFKDIYFENIYTYTEQEFEQKFVRKLTESQKEVLSNE